LICMIMINNITTLVDALGQCETLGPDACLTAYPDCLIIPVLSCCSGIGSICVSSSYLTVIDLRTKDPNSTICLRHIAFEQVFQLSYNIPDIPGYHKFSITITEKNVTCMDCPAGFLCDRFAWGIMCTEWSDNTTRARCKDSQSECLSGQTCNSKNLCEFAKCDETLCGPKLSCVQFDQTHPRVCASRNVVPFSQMPTWLENFPFLSQQDGEFARR
ncbi:hypothetical protein SAMD00019534_111080, partial [Acytostelium subglobosum LB1]|uniref:hypothetical protein n=1 Tax=Acytostelium subglobosum LB1 TaxID=1410327 RepID=UPI000644AC20